MSDVDERLARFAAREERARERRSHGEDVRAAAKLVVSATRGVMGVVGDLQRAFSPPIVSHVATMVNHAVRESTTLVGAGLDAAIAALSPVLGASVPGAEREAVLAALNGVVGDRLASAGSPLAIEMTLRPPLDQRRQGTLLLFVHGSSGNDLQWTTTRGEGDARVVHDHGRALLRDLERDVTLAYLHYNSGLHIKHNGDALAALIERESAGFDELMVVCHSMGGLVVRSAVCAAEREGLSWWRRLTVLVTLGTPHHGAPLERIGHIAELVLGVTPWTAPIASLGAVRSAGITDLRWGNVIDIDDDRFEHSKDTRSPAPLPEGVRCYAVAATRSPQPAVSPRDDELAALSNDNLVPVPSALGMHDDPARTLAFLEHQIVYATSHIGLLASPEVYALLRRWCA